MPPLSIVVLVALLNTTWVPPLQTVVLLAVPASFWVPPLDTVVPLAVPPDSTFCVPPLSIVVAVALLNTTWVPPDSVVLLADAGVIHSVPPLDTVVPPAVPPAATFCVPPLSIVVAVALLNTTWRSPDSVVLLAVPLSYWVPPLSTVAALAVPPAETA